MSSSEETSGNEKDGLQDTSEGRTSVFSPNDYFVIVPYYLLHVAQKENLLRAPELTIPSSRRNNKEFWTLSIT